MSSFSVVLISRGTSDTLRELVDRSRKLQMIRLAYIAATLALVAGCSDSPDKSKNVNASTNNVATNNVGTNNVGTNSMSTNNGAPTLDTDMVDLLVVLDNSGSMCQEQTTLRNNSELLFEALANSGADFHIGLTTTDMNPDYALEPVSQPGRLQATPQPVPGFDRSCHTAVDESGMPIAGDYTPIRQAIAAAVDCMTVPDESLNNVSNADIECALYASPQGCTIASAGCGGGSPCVAEDLFPSPSSYRPLPTVLRAEDYGGPGELDVARLKTDFACMSFVGTRGYGIEKGLAASAAAVDPTMTGGAVDGPSADTSAPNHGLLRHGSKFALLFITDENDCSHDGSLREDTPCGGDVCEFANKASSTNSPLIAPSEIKDQLMDNLRASKGLPDLSPYDVFVGSIHGNARRFDGDVPTDAQCGGPEYDGISPTCASSLGRAFSGDRYERFLREFPSGQIFPAANPGSPDAALTGWMCTGDFRPALQAVGEALVDSLDLR